MQNIWIFKHFDGFFAQKVFQAMQTLHSFSHESKHNQASKHTKQIPTKVINNSCPFCLKVVTLHYDFNNTAHRVPNDFPRLCRGSRMGCAHC